MAIRQLLKVSKKTFFDPASWVGYDSLKENNRTLWGSIKGLFIAEKPLREETFEAAMVRLGLSEAEIKKIGSTYRLYARIFLIVALCLFIYTMYLFFNDLITHSFGLRSITALMLGGVATALLLSQAFKYDFWAFQIAKRKLGATFAEWQQSILGGKGTSS